jgi:hypothetical protein
VRVGRIHAGVIGAVVLVFLSVSGGSWQPVASAMEDAGDGGKSSFSFYQVATSAAPFRAIVDRNFLVRPLVNASAISTAGVLRSAGESAGSAAVATPGPVETAGALLPAIMPRNTDDIAQLLDSAPGLLALPLPAVKLPIPNVPLPEVPLPGVPALPNQAFANYPFRPEVSTGAYRVADNPVIQASAASGYAHALEHQVYSEANGIQMVSGLVGPTGMISVEQIKSSSRIDVLSDNIVSLSETALSKIDIAGIIKIGSLVASAESKAAGSKAGRAAHFEIKLADVTAFGLPARIDAQGVHIVGNEQNVGALASLNDALAKQLSAQGVGVSLIPSGKESTGEGDRAGVVEAVGTGLRITATADPKSLPLVGSSPTTVEFHLADVASMIDFEVAREDPAGTVGIGQGAFYGQEPGTAGEFGSTVPSNSVDGVGSSGNGALPAGEGGKESGASFDSGLSNAFPSDSEGAPEGSQPQSSGDEHLGLGAGAVRSGSAPSVRAGVVVGAEPVLSSSALGGAAGWALVAGMGVIALAILGAARARRGVR